MSARSGSQAGSRAAPEADACALSNDLGWALGVVFRCYLKASQDALADLPGGPRGFQVLAAAARDQHGSQLALAHRLGVDRTVMTYLLDDLEAAGIIERRPDPADRRARRILATARGCEALADAGQRLRAAEEQVLSCLDGEEDRGRFRSLLRRLALHASVADPVRGACDTAAEAIGTDPAGGPVLPC
jgi:DNA-binding MarR family transcriptional regulator